MTRRAVRGYRFDEAQLKLVGTELVLSFDIYGSLEPMGRSLLGQDALLKLTVGLDLYGDQIFVWDRSSGPGVEELTQAGASS